MNMAGFYARLAPSLIQIIELTLVIAALAMIFFGSRNAGRTRRRFAGFEYVEDRFRRLARRKIAVRRCGRAAGWFPFASP